MSHAPGIYPSLDLAQYLAIKAVNGGLLSTLLAECPLKAWHESPWNPQPRPADDSEESDIGTVAHAVLLEGSAACCEILDPENYPAEKTGAIPAGYTNKAIRAARDQARLNGRIPILKPKWKAIEDMVSAANRFIGSLRQTEPAIWSAFQPDGGDSELSVLFNDAVGDVLCKVRFDRISRDRGVIINFKTTSGSVEPDRWGRAVLPDHDVSAAFYTRAAYSAFGREPQHYFLCAETAPPHLCSLIGLNPEWREIANGKVKLALREWNKCVSENHWPGYPNRAAFPELAPWERARWEERQSGGGFPYDPAVLFEKTK